jgi:hypothetical protein
MELHPSSRQMCDEPMTQTAQKPKPAALVGRKLSLAADQGLAAGV